MIAALVASAVVIGFFLSKESPLSATYAIDIRFDDVAGLKEGAPVTLQGAHVGRVEALSLVEKDPPRFLRSSWVARVAIRDEPWIRSKLTPASTFAVQPESLFGNKFVNVTFGEEGPPLAPGSVVQGVVAAGVDARTFDKLSVALDNFSGAAAELRGILASATGGAPSGGTTAVGATGTAHVGVDGQPPEAPSATAQKAPSIQATLANLDETLKNTAESTRALKEALSTENQEKAKTTFDDLSKSAANLAQVTERMKSGMDSWSETMERLRFWRGWFGEGGNNRAAKEKEAKEREAKEKAPAAR